MVILREILGTKRVELQRHPVILPTTAWDGMNPGERMLLQNDALDYAVISWDDDELVQITPSAAYKGAFAQYQTRVKQDLDIDIPDNRIFGAA